MSEATLARAQAGDEHAFRDLTEPYRRELHLHCYRMLGSLADAEDTVQETLLAAWRGLPGFQGRSSVRGWLYRIATNRCLNAIRDGKRRVPREPVPPFEPPPPTRRGDVTWLQPYPDTLLEQRADPAPGPEARYDASEAVELAFVAALQRLPPRQTATLLLRDVLGYPAGEVAAMLDTTETAGAGTLQRARAALAEHHPATRPAAPPAGSARERSLTRRFADAFTAGDVAGVVALLTDDAWLAMPPAPHEYHGGAAIAGFLKTSMDWRRGQKLVLVPIRANTQPGFGCYLTGAGDPTARSIGLVVLTLAGDRIGGITRFLDGDLAHRFGLPEKIE